MTVDLLIFLFVVEVVVVKNNVSAVEVADLATRTVVVDVLVPSMGGVAVRLRMVGAALPMLPASAMTSCFLMVSDEAAASARIQDSASVIEGGKVIVYSTRIGPGVNFRNRLDKAPRDGCRSFTSICSMVMFVKPLMASFTPIRKAFETIALSRIASLSSTYTDQSPRKCLACTGDGQARPSCKQHH